MITSPYYRTADTALATYLLCSGFKLHQIDFSNPRYEFIFPSNNGIQEHINRYFIGQALVDPAAYQRVNRKLIRLVKNRITTWGE